MLFIFISTVFFLGYGLLFKRRNHSRFKFYKIVFPLLLLTNIVATALGINYVAAMIPGAYDGIGINNYLARIIIGDATWTIELFRNYFNTSITLGIVLLVLYCALYFFDV